MKEEYFLAHFDPELRLKEIVSSLSYEDIEPMAEERIYKRGFGYFKQGYVKDIVWSESSMNATVEGSEGAMYEVDIFLDEEGDLLGQCDCPYYDTCKHIVAVLLQAREKPTATEQEKNKDAENFLAYLSGLKKEELITLVDRFAPENYRIEIAMRNASILETEKAIQKLQVLMYRTMQNHHLLYDPDAFFDEVEKYLEMLEAYLSKNPEMVFNAVFDLAKKISELSDNGFLFSDSYYDEYNYFDYDTFSVKILKLINRISDDAVQANIIVDFANLFESSDYFYFDYNLIEIKDKSILIGACDEITSLSFYDYMKDVFDFDQSLAYLKRFPEDKVVIQKVALFEAYGKREEAIKYLETLLLQKFTVAYAEYLIKLKKISQERLSQLVSEAIESSEYTAYDFVAAHIGECQEIEKLEKQMKQQRPHWYYEYLAKHKRVEEMYKMLKRVPHEKADFFSKYKKRYPDEAIRFYNEVISDELAYTGDVHYTTIADALSHLQVLLPKDVFDTKVNQLKTEYKRRRNFIKILERRFNGVNKKLF